MVKARVRGSQGRGPQLFAERSGRSVGQQGQGRHGQRSGKALDHIQRDVSLSALDITQVGLVEATALSQLFLGEPCMLPGGSQIARKLFAQRRRLIPRMDRRIWPSPNPSTSFDFATS